MRKTILTIAATLAVVLIFAQSGFEGQLTVTYKVDKEQPVVAQLKIKGNQVHIQQTQNGNKKYDFFIVDLSTKDFYTVSTADKKVIIKYRFDQLIDFYVANKLKEGYQKSYDFNFKATDKSKEEYGYKLVKAVGETDSLKASVWSTEAKIPINQLIPLLRLMGNWNEAQGTDGAILEAEVNSKAGKTESSVKVEVKKETISKSAFNLPEGYLTKDFAKLMEEEKGNGKLAVLVQTFADF